MAVADSIELVFSLIGYPDETEWIEFKSNNDEPHRLAEDISALANAAAFHGREYAYKLWGIEDGSHQMVGTKFNPLTAKGVGNQNLQIWLKRVMRNAVYEFENAEFDGKRFVTLKIRAANGQPVYYDKKAYIREGSSTTRLEPGTTKEAELWRRLQRESFEMLVAEPDVMPEELDNLLDIECYFDLLRLRHPSDQEGLVIALSEPGLIRQQDNGRYAITNLGALLIAKRLSYFPGLRKRPLRVIRFEGSGNFTILNDWTFDQGYALALRAAEERIVDALPAHEVLEGAFRRVKHLVPRAAVRELLSNAIMHQDLSETTASPLVCIHDDRIEFSNPGATLIPRDRLLNAQPKTRNGELVGILRQMDLCEEGGTGWDIIVSSCEAEHLPAPRIETSEESGTRVTIYGERSFSQMTKRERKSAAYWHACLMYAQNDPMGNRSLRDRFGLDGSDKNVVAISRLIRDCCRDGLLKGSNDEASARYRTYIPGWA